MGALTDELARRAAVAGAELATGAEVTAIEADGLRARSPGTARGAATTSSRPAPRRARPAARRARRNAPGGRPAEGQHAARALPRLRDASVRPEEAFAGTFHVNETYAQLEAAYEDASDGSCRRRRPVRDLLPLADRPEDPRPGAARSGPHADAVRAAHARAAVRVRGRPRRRRRSRRPCGRSTRCWPEPIEDCLLRTPDGEPCLEAKTPLDLERELGMPGGNIFHRDLAWPFAEDEAEVGRWGVETGDRQRPARRRRRAAAAASAASPATTPRWRSCAQIITDPTADPQPRRPPGDTAPVGDFRNRGRPPAARSGHSVPYRAQLKLEPACARRADVRHAAVHPAKAP